MAKTFIEGIAQKLRIIPNLDREDGSGNYGPLRKYPASEEWNEHIELDANAWPDRVERKYSLVPTTCLNCETAC